jgi:hypothetical protein
MFNKRENVKVLYTDNQYKQMAFKNNFFKKITIIVKNERNLHDQFLMIAVFADMHSDTQT